MLSLRCSSETQRSRRESDGADHKATGRTACYAPFRRLSIWRQSAESWPLYGAASAAFTAMSQGSLPVGGVKSGRLIGHLERRAEAAVVKVCVVKFVPLRDVTTFQMLGFFSLGNLFDLDWFKTVQMKFVSVRTW